MAAGSNRAASQVGRIHEQRQIADLIARARVAGDALLLSGGPGTGKTALTSYGSHQARLSGMQVLALAGRPRAVHRPYAGLGQLLESLSLRRNWGDGTEASIALRLTDSSGGRPEAADVVRDVAALLSRCAADGPVLLLVDDAQWLDPETCNVLAALPLRTATLPIAMLVAYQTGYDLPLPGVDLPSLTLAELNDWDAERLLRRSPSLSPAQRESINALAQGNPLALTLLSGHETAGGGSVEDIDTEHPYLHPRLAAAFAARWQELPRSVRVAALAAALDRRHDRNTVLEAAGRLTGRSDPPSLLRSAVHAGLIQVNGRQIKFNHPLTALAIRQATAPAELARVHDALAKSSAHAEQAHHLARAHRQPSTRASGTAELLAHRARAAGDQAAANTLTELAARLTPHGPERSRRLLRCAETAYATGETLGARALLGALSMAPPGEAERLRLALLREKLNGAPGRTETVPRLRALGALARDAHNLGSAELAAEFLVAAARLCANAAVPAGENERLARLALNLAESDPQVLTFVLAFTVPRLLSPALRAQLPRWTHERQADVVVLGRLGSAAVALGALSEANALFSRALPKLLESPHPWPEVTHALHDAAAGALYAGAWAHADHLATDLAQRARVLGDTLWRSRALAIQAVAAAVQGRSAPPPQGPGTDDIGTDPRTRVHRTWARAITALANGEYADAYLLLERMHDRVQPDGDTSSFLLWTLADLADAAALSGRGDDARLLLARTIVLNPTREQAAHLLFSNLLLRGRNGPEDPSPAVVRDQLKAAPFLGGRLALASGEWSRRQHRNAVARTWLTLARSIFAEVDAAPWLRRAEQELLATQGRRPATASGTTPTLTPQESKIAALAAEGLSNRAIAERLNLSPRTVASHLRRTFLKLGIDSRAQLTASQFEDEGPQTAPPSPTTQGMQSVRCSITVPRQLPRKPSGLCGRDNDLARAQALLDRAADAHSPQTILLTGMPGSGKSTFAVHWAQQLQLSYPDGQIYLDLRGHSRFQPLAPHDALGRILDALGFPGKAHPADSAARSSLVNSAVRGRRLLLILDNALGTNQVLPLILAPPSLTLVTSRQYLSGLTVSQHAEAFTVTPLAPDGSAEILASGCPRAAADPHNAAVLANLSGHLPLALVTAANRLNNEPAMNMHALVQTLVSDRPLDAFTRLDGSNPVRTAFRRSHQGIAPPSARMLQLLSASPDTSVTPTAAASIAGVTLPVARSLLRNLAHLGLLMPLDPGYHAVHPLLRAFAREAAAGNDSKRAFD